MCINRSGEGIAIIGSGGAIGRALAGALPLAVTAARRGAGIFLDLADPDGAFRALERARPRLAVLAAGVTSIAACERDPAATRLANVEGTLRLARRFSDMGARVVWFSSDYVFDGQAPDYPDEAQPSPLNEYGRQKAEVERELPAVCGGKCLILRLGKVYGDTAGDGTLLDEMFASLAAGREVRAARDQFFNQVYLPDVVKASMLLMDRDASGTYNVCAPGARSRLDIALMAARALSAPESLIRPISLDDLGEDFVRPKRVVLLPDRITRESGFAFRPIEDAVARLARVYLAKGGVHA